MKIQKTALAAAMTAALGTASIAPANAAVIEFSFNGLFTMLTSAGNPLVNTDYQGNSWGGNRTDITGTMTFDTNTGAGSGTVVPFYFFNGGYAQANAITMQAIGNGMGGPGTLVLGNMSFTWNGNTDIPVSIVLDAAGMFGAMMMGPMSIGQTISGMGTYGASDGMSSGAYHMGLMPVSTTTWNTTTVPGTALGNPTPSGTLPLIADTATVTNYDGDPLTAGYQNACPADLVPGTKAAQTGWQCALGIGGSPMQTAPFAGYNANFDIASLTVTNIIPDQQPVPLPAAVWLLGSGLLGLVGIGRRKKSA